jgi:serine/threonine protein kinase
MDTRGEYLLDTPEALGDYTSLALVGQGSFSTVYVATHKTLKGKFALKVSKSKTEASRLLNKECSLYKILELGKSLTKINLNGSESVGKLNDAAYVHGSHIVLDYVETVSIP